MISISPTGSVGSWCGSRTGCLHPQSIWRVAGTELSRGDYCRLIAAGVIEPSGIAVADDVRLLDCLDADTTKIRLIRDAAQRIEAPRHEASPATVPILKPYEG